ncbi:MAG: hypothetical protein J3K34DRAFT_381894 [Monoraphidium minutum]|nr:MAG: hypothetical protein J3K34DRAFT_381894 [Monoraphidium minutum]
MSESGDEAVGPTPPKVVEYDPITGVPPEYNANLPTDTPEFKRWKAVQDGGAEALAALSLAEAGGDPAAAQAAAAAAAKGAKSAPQIVLESATRNKKKCVTTISGLEGFGVKLSEAAKVFGKKFACGASVVKTAIGGEEIDMQARGGRGGGGDYVNQLAELVVKNYGASHGVKRSDVYVVEGKRKRAYFGEEGGGDGGE